MDRFVLVHGGYRTGNVLIDDDRVTAILDWEPPTNRVTDAIRDQDEAQPGDGLGGLRLNDRPALRPPAPR